MCLRNPKMANLRRSTMVSIYLCILWNTLANGSLLEAASNSKGDSNSTATNFKAKGLDACINCDKKHASIRKSKNSTFPRHALGDNAFLNKVLPDESEKIVFSRKYNPEMTHDDGFMPVPGPYGTKSARLARANLVQPPDSGLRFGTAAPRSINAAVKHAHHKHHANRGEDLNSSQQNVQRRVQFRNPTAVEDHTVKESISSENILGNGNFEIIRGGIYSDQDRNEIIGSRRIGRGFPPFGVPTYQQPSKFSPIRSVQFPLVYQGHVQNQFNPVFYPRAPY